jgi:hypothetical protein
MFIPFRAEYVKTQSNRTGEKSVRIEGKMAFLGAAFGKRAGKCRGQ